MTAKPRTFSLRPIFDDPRSRHHDHAATIRGAFAPQRRRGGVGRVSLPMLLSLVLIIAAVLLILLNS